MVKQNILTRFGLKGHKWAFSLKDWRVVFVPFVTSHSLSNVMSLKCQGINSDIMIDRSAAYLQITYPRRKASLATWCTPQVVLSGHTLWFMSWRPSVLATGSFDRAPGQDGLIEQIIICLDPPMHECGHNSLQLKKFNLFKIFHETCLFVTETVVWACQVSYSVTVIMKQFNFKVRVYILCGSNIEVMKKVIVHSI